MTVLDSQSELMAAALKYLGYSVNDRDPKHWQQAKDVILKAKPYWAAFNASSYIQELSAGNIWVVHGYSNDIYQADLGRRRRQEVPHPPQPAQGRRGAGAGRHGHRQERAASRPGLKFINFMLEGQNSADLTNMIGSGNPNARRAEVHQAGDQADLGHLPGRADGEEAGDAEGHDAAAAAADEPHLDRDQGEVGGGAAVPSVGVVPARR